MTGRLWRGSMVFCGLMILWGLASRSGIPHFLLPSPMAVAEALWVNRAYLGWHTLITLSEILSGLALGVTLGVTLALGMILSPRLQRWLMPLVLTSQAIPVFALAPLLVLWLGFGMSAKVAMAVLVIFFPVTSAFFDGLRRVNQEYLDLARSMNASFGAQLRHVRLMAALPALGSGLRMAAAVAVAPIGAIIGEWVGSAEGLGYVMLNANARLQTDICFAALFILVGVWLTDADNKQYLDCLAGAGTLALGHNHPDVLQSIQSVITSGLPLHTLDLTTPLKDRFSEYLLSCLPGEGKEYCLQFTGPSGADAVEAALKLAKKYTGRTAVISFSGGYHGMTHGALSVTGNLSPKAAVNGMMPEVQFMPYPHLYRCPLGIGGEAGVKALTYYFENLINDVESGVRKPAAVILEAVQGEGGVNPAPVEWLQRIRKVTEEHGILLIVDEVQAGFARTGKFFAFEHAGIQPDIIVMSKAVGGGLPLAVLGIKKQFDAWEPGHHTGTFRGNQLAMATGLTTLRHLRDNKIADKVAAQGEWLKGKLAELQKRYPVIGHVRGLGLMIGIEIVKPNEAQDHMGCYPADGELSALLQKKCFEAGLILERGGRHGCVLRLLPSLLISDAELDVFLDKFEQALLAAGVKPV